MQKNKYKVLLPLAFAIVLILGMYIGGKFAREMNSGSGSMIFPFYSSSNKIQDVLRLINKKYVDTINIGQIEDETINDLLTKLDPHSAYIPAADYKAVNESLEGNFEGIGVEFYLLNDTIYVVSALTGGPSEQLGIKAGDKIVKIDGRIVAGKKIKNSDVTAQLRGPSGTKVKVSILRKGQKNLLDFTIVRGRIPLNSVDVSYMAAQGIGYLKVSSFGATTYDEFYEAMTKLKSQGMVSLILDLRGNPGGYLGTAIMISDEFLGDKKMIVYTQGKSSPKKEEYATAAGNFEKGKLIVLIDEGSASASEIVAGAVQDWDRGVIVGRRSFGKGLVQEQTMFPDGSAMRLTTARYYTPTGRCIQKSYKDGFEKYNEDVVERYKHGELLNADSIKISDTLKFVTPSGKIVYGGGGISPDIFVPIDTSNYSTYYGEVISRGLIADFCYDLIDRNKSLFSEMKDFDEFNNTFMVNDKIFVDFITFVSQKGVKKDLKGVKISGRAIRTQIKAIIARQLYKNEGYYKVMQELDKGIKKSVELLQAS
jgi:carboxyl-terminal processing protease